MSLDKASYLRGLLDAKLEVDFVVSVMESVYEGNPTGLKGALDALQQVNALINDKIETMEQQK